MNKIKLGDLKKVLLYLTLPIILTNCGKKAECDYPNRHAHQYIQTLNKTGINNERITVKKYLINEEIERNHYVRQDNLIEINANDEECLDKIVNCYRINEENWPYLYNVMSQFHDYLEFEYEYEDTETYTETDSDGEVHTYTRTVTKYDWHRNQNDIDNTGEVRIVHQRIRAAKLIKEYPSKNSFFPNKKPKVYLKLSKAVDDIREVTDEYTYALDGDKGIEIVYKYFTVPWWELRNLTTYDPRFNTFKHPDLSNKTMYLNGSNNTDTQKEHFIK